MVTYEEFVVLAALNLWVEDGLPADYVIGFAASSSEGDPRGGTVSKKLCQNAFDDMLQRGWIRLGKASDASNRTFAYSTPTGVAVFEECKGSWMDQV